MSSAARSGAHLMAILGAAGGGETGGCRLFYATRPGHAGAASRQLHAPTSGPCVNLADRISWLSQPSEVLAQNVGPWVIAVPRADH